MAVIAVGSRPETPDVTKFFELPAVDRRFEGMAMGAGRTGGLRILGIHISVGGRVETGRKGVEEVERGRGFSSVINTDSFLPTAILNHTKKSRRRDGGFS